MKSNLKILLLGLGPSAYCAQYMEYKLRLLLPDKLVLAVTDTVGAESFVDEDTLLVIFSTSGRFKSFEPLLKKVYQRGGKPVLVIEEYHPDLIQKYEPTPLIFLSDSVQSSDLKAYEKSRILTFIYIEEVLFKIMRENEN